MVPKKVGVLKKVRVFKKIITLKKVRTFVLLGTMILGMADFSMANAKTQHLTVAREGVVSSIIQVETPPHEELYDECPIMGAFRYSSLEEFLKRHRQ